jgi:hypothetical protein
MKEGGGAQRCKKRPLWPVHKNLGWEIFREE